MMHQFVLLFRMDISTPEAQPSQEQMKTYMQQWTAWIDTISSKGMLAEGGNHFVPIGKVIRPKNALSNKPYTVNNESLAGYIIILAADFDAALKVAERCPILAGDGTSVEIRQVAMLEN